MLACIISSLVLIWFQCYTSWTIPIRCIGHKMKFTISQTKNKTFHFATPAQVVIYLPVSINPNIYAYMAYKKVNKIKTSYKKWRYYIVVCIHILTVKFTRCDALFYDVTFPYIYDIFRWLMVRELDIIIVIRFLPSIIYLRTYKPICTFLLSFIGFYLAQSQPHKF